MRPAQSIAAMSIAALAALALAAPAAADSVSYRFAWEGGGGYRMEGAIAFDAGLLGAAEVRETDLQCFFIEGTRDGVPIGRWALGHLMPDTTWILTFLPAEGAFAVYGPGHLMPQAWNMDGAGRNCGAGGFGFNIGNAAQDLCRDNRLLFESQVPPSRPFPAERAEVAFPADACIGPPLLSEAR
jgi:hypothetical protein